MHRGAGLLGYHEHSVLEFIFDGTNWIVSPIDRFKVGNYGTGRNSAGGVDVDCEGAVWASGDALNFPSPAIYGITRIPATGNQADFPHGSNSHLIDLDGITNTGGRPKTYIGDVEVFDVCSPCFDVTEITVDCPEELNGPFIATFTLTNRSPQTIAYLLHTPCPAADLPAGATSGPLLPTGWQTLPAPLAPGDSTVVTVQIPSAGLNANDRFCWNITFFDRTGGECCRDKVCVPIPDCECFVVLDKTIECEVDADGTVKYFVNFNLQNTSAFTWYTLNLLPLNPFAASNPFTPSSFDLSSSPVPPGGTYQFTTCLTGNPGDALCFFIAVHAEDYEICCSKECCIVLPPCDGVQLDEFAVSRQVPCCPDEFGNVASYITLVVCNNSAFPRTYDWTINPIPAMGNCTATLSPSALVMPSGSIPVGPNSCAQVIIQVNCEELNAGDRACYEVCVQQQGNPANTFCGLGIIYVPQDPDIGIKIDQPVVNAESPRNVLRVSNPSDEPRHFVFEVVSLGAATEIRSPDGSTEGAALRQVFEINLEGGEEREVEVFVSLTDRELPPLSLNPFVVNTYNEQGQISQTVGTFVYLRSQDAERLAIMALEVSSSGELTFNISTQPGKRYALESSNNLGSEQDWTLTSCSASGSSETASEFIAQGKELVLNLTLNPDCSASFYRAVEIPAAQ